MTDCARKKSDNVSRLAGQTAYGQVDVHRRGHCPIVYNVTNSMHLISAVLIGVSWLH